MTQALKVEDERAVVMDPSTPRGDGGAEGHPTGLKGGKSSGKRKGEGGGEGEEIQEDLLLLVLQQHNNYNTAFDQSWLVRLGWWLCLPSSMHAPQATGHDWWR
jgi:hypothetical protein